jgi:hypothetical protein
MTSLMPYTDPISHPTLPIPEILANQLEKAQHLAASADPDAQEAAKSHAHVADMITEAMARHRAEREAWKTPRSTELL